MHCAGRQCALCDQMKVAQRTKKALKDTPRESYQLYHTWRRWRGALISRHTALARRVVHFSPDGDACLQGPLQLSRCTSGTGAHSAGAIRLCAEGKQEWIAYAHTSRRCGAGPGGGFDINATDCDYRAFSSKVINRHAALWLPSSSSARPR